VGEEVEPGQINSEEGVDGRGVGGGAAEEQRWRGDSRQILTTGARLTDPNEAVHLREDLLLPRESRRGRTDLDRRRGRPPEHTRESRSRRSIPSGKDGSKTAPGERLPTRAERKAR
jgi:hypothetical protein